MAVQSFDDAAHLERIDENTFKANVPDGWQQGRGAFGGLVVGMCLRAMDAVQEGTERRLRTATAQIPSPVLTGETILEVNPLRRGRGVDALEVRLIQEGETRAAASAIYGATRPVDVADEPEPPSLPPPAPHLQMPPRFTAHFEMGCTGPVPFTGNKEARVEGWVGPRVPFRSMGAPEIACLCDVFWPAVFAQLTAFRPAATVGFMLQTTPRVFAHPPGEAVFYRAWQTHASEGFSHEVREVWNKQAELLAINTQTFAIIK